MFLRVASRRAFPGRSKRAAPLLGTGTLSGFFYPTRTMKTKAHSTPLQDFPNELRHTATLSVAVWQIPHIEKQKKGGEDTYFMSTEGTIMGVFDGSGVGGWAEVGVDPRQYSYALAMACKQGADEQFHTDPETVLQYGYDKVKGIRGSCTATVANITGSQLSAINLGDSGFRVVRKGEIVLASEEQQHVFNMPFQLGEESKDAPKDGKKYKFSLADGDIVVLGTDGLFDNVFDDKIAKIVNDNSQRKAQEIARKIADYAFQVAYNHRAYTPFCENAKNHGYHGEEGGKPDDITVMVAKFNEIHAKL